MWVTNRTRDTVSVTWRGETFQFAPDTPVDVPMGVAEDFFGYGLPDKTEALLRLGWVRMAIDIPAALRRLDEIEITNEQPQSYRSPSPAAVGSTPLPLRRVGGKVSG